MYNISLSPGDEIPIYLDYKNQAKFEGTATLIEKKEVGDTFYMDKEKLYKHYPSKSSLVVKPDEMQLKMNKLKEYLDHYTKSSNSDVRSFCRRMKKLCSVNLNSYNEMYTEVEEWKNKYREDPAFINNILRVDTKYIVRYFQQKYLSNWSPTIFKKERWIVEFPVQRHPLTGEILFNSLFRTARWITVVVAISPSDESRITTYNNKNITRKTDDEDDDDCGDVQNDGMDDSYDNSSIHDKPEHEEDEREPDSDEPGFDEDGYNNVDELVEDTSDELSDDEYMS